MEGAKAAVAAEDFKKLLERHGLNLIAERVEDEKTVVQLLDFAVDFGQGYLFGEPRAVREEFAQVHRTKAATVGPRHPAPARRLRLPAIDRRIAPMRSAPHGSIPPDPARSFRDRGPL